MLFIDYRLIFIEGIVESGSGRFNKNGHGKGKMFNCLCTYFDSPGGFLWEKRGKTEYKADT
jgi:hypothetical protein